MSLGSEYENLTIDQIRPPYAFVYGLLILATIVLSLFRSLDENRLLFAGCFIGAGLMSAYYLQYARKRKANLQGVSIVFFVVLWLGIHAFSNHQNIIDFASLSINFTIKQVQVNYLAIFPLVAVWMVPYNPDTFFGLSDVTRDIAIRSLWKYSLLLIIVIKFFDLPQIFEFAILIPFVSEHVKLYNSTKNNPPVLTLFVQKELTERFAVPISFLKAVGIIMVLFLFSVLDSRLWLLVILGYFLAGFLWAIDAIIPESERRRSGSRSKEERKPKEDRIDTVFGTADKKKRTQQDPIQTSDTEAEVEVEITDAPVVEISTQENTDMILVEDQAKVVTSASQAGGISEKAFQMGRRVRTELQKPQYNLNHILSTLSGEDFSTAYRVTRPGMQFHSLSGNWQPPMGLIVIPIELEAYDFRREGEILLLGFNKPDESSRKKSDKPRSESNIQVSDNAIRFGSVIFNMKTLVVRREDWEMIKNELEKVDPDEDISYTGFTTLNQLQEKLGMISEKWIEIRQTAKEATVNFVAGLMGANDPIFLGTGDIKLQEGEYLVETIDDENVENTSK